MAPLPRQIKLLYVVCMKSSSIPLLYESTSDVLYTAQPATLTQRCMHVIAARVLLPLLGWLMLGWCALLLLAPVLGFAFVAWLVLYG